MDNKNIENNVSNVTKIDDNDLNIEKNTYLLKRFRILNKLGKGAYGNVLKCLDIKYNETVAIKICKKEYIYYETFKIETDILTLMYNNYRTNKKYKDKPELISLIYKYFYYDVRPCIVLKLYYLNLYKGLRTKPADNKLKSIITDLFNALIFLKDCNIIHGDIKPENILFYNSDMTNVVLCDFGLSYVNSETSKGYNIQTAWYRSPEIVLRMPYSYEIDWWSIAVIIYELHFFKALFPGNTNYELAYYYNTFLGEPPNKYMNSYTKLLKKKSNNDIPTDLIKKNTDVSNAKNSINISVSKNYQYLLFNLITWEPDKRLSPEECLKHL